MLVATAILKTWLLKRELIDHPLGNIEVANCGEVAINGGDSTLYTNYLVDWNSSRLFYAIYQHKLFHGSVSHCLRST